MERTLKEVIATPYYFYSYLFPTHRVTFYIKTSLGKLKILFPLTKYFVKFCMRCFLIRYYTSSIIVQKFRYEVCKHRNHE